MASGPNRLEALRSVIIYMTDPITLPAPYTNGTWTWDSSTYKRAARHSCIARNFDGVYKNFSVIDKINPTNNDYKTIEYNEKIFIEYTYFRTDYLGGASTNYLNWCGFCPQSANQKVSDMIPSSGNMNPFDVYDLMNTTAKINSSATKIIRKLLGGNGIAIKVNNDTTSVSAWTKIGFTTSKYEFDTSSKFVSWNGITKIITDDNYFTFSHINPSKLLTYASILTLTSYVCNLFDYGYTAWG